MSEGQIPIGINDLPIDTVPLSESDVYSGVLNKSTISPKLDKKGNIFASVQIEVSLGDFEGRTVMLNYLPLPVPIREDMSKGERIRAQDRAVAFARFCRAFRITGNMPSVSFAAPDSITAWQEWIEKFYGNNGKFTVKNQEFPEGSGRLRSGVNDFVF